MLGSATLEMATIALSVPLLDAIGNSARASESRVLAVVTKGLTLLAVSSTPGMLTLALVVIAGGLFLLTI